MTMWAQGDLHPGRHCRCAWRTMLVPRWPPEPYLWPRVGFLKLCLRHVATLLKSLRGPWPSIWRCLKETLCADECPTAAGPTVPTARARGTWHWPACVLGRPAQHCTWSPTCPCTQWPVRHGQKGQRHFQVWPGEPPSAVTVPFPLLWLSSQVPKMALHLLGTWVLNHCVTD